MIRHSWSLSLICYEAKILCCVQIFSTANKSRPELKMLSYGGVHSQRVFLLQIGSSE